MEHILFFILDDLRHIQKITSQYASLICVILRQHIHLIAPLWGKYTSLSDAKYTMHLWLIIFFHMPKYNNSNKEDFIMNEKGDGQKFVNMKSVGNFTKNAIESFEENIVNQKDYLEKVKENE